MNCEALVSDAPESLGCLLIVASFTDIASTVGMVTADTSTRLLISPVLGDFIELRHVDMGARPRDESERAGVPARIADEFTKPTGGAVENYFGLMVVDDSAATVGLLLRDCRMDPAIAALPLRCRGLAVVEDRPPAREPRADFVVLPQDGLWTRRTLADELRNYADDLLRSFTTTYRRGLTYDDLASIRSTHGPFTIAEDETVLDLRPAVPSALISEPVPRPLTSESEPRTAAPDVRAAAPDVRAAVPDVRAAVPEVRVVNEIAGGPALRGRVPRLWGGRAAGDGAATSEAARALVYLILTDGVGSDDRSVWRRGRALLVEIDRKIAAVPGSAYWMRVMTGAYEAVRSSRQPAGRLSARTIRRSASPFDFARLLAQLRVTMRRDLTAAGRPAPLVGRPVVVIFAADVPLGDAITVEEYTALAESASVIWVVPDRTSHLMSPYFAIEGVVILTDHHDVADEVVTLMRVDVPRQQTDAPQKPVTG